VHVRVVLLLLFLKRRVFEKQVEDSALTKCNTEKDIIIAL